MSNFRIPKSAGTLLDNKGTPTKPMTPVNPEDKKEKLSATSFFAQLVRERHGVTKEPSPSPPMIIDLDSNSGTPVVIVPPGDDSNLTPRLGPGPPPPSEDALDGEVKAKISILIPPKSKLSTPSYLDGKVNNENTNPMQLPLPPGTSVPTPHHGKKHASVVSGRTLYENISGASEALRNSLSHKFSITKDLPMPSSKYTNILRLFTSFFIPESLESYCLPMTYFLIHLGK